MRIVLARTMYDWEGAPREYQETIDAAVARRGGCRRRARACPTLFYGISVAYRSEAHSYFTV